MISKTDQRAIEVALDLDNWLMSVIFSADRPHASAAISAGATAVTIDDFVVFDSEEHDSSQLTVDACKTRFLDQVRQLCRFLPEDELIGSQLHSALQEAADG